MLAGELGHLAASTGHELRTAIDDDVWCLGDDARILQIGRALATNAMTHTPAGTTVTLASAAARSDRAELVGRGRRARDSRRRQRDAVFARFYRVEGGMASGSGLGLAIAREIARVMGGDVRLDSEARADAVHARSPRRADAAGRAADARSAFSRENAPPAPERVPQG